MDKRHSTQFKVLRVGCATLAAVFFVTMAPAAESVRVSNAWARATAPGQKTAVVYLDLRSDANAALVAADTPLAARAELHSMSTAGGVMRMRSLPRIELPAGKTVRLAPNSAHLMLIDLKQPLKAGDKVPLVLSVQSSRTSLARLKIEAVVRAEAGKASHQH